MSDGGDRYVLFMRLKCNILVVVTLEPRVVDRGTNTPLLCFFRAATSSHKALTAVPAPKKRTRTFPSRSHTSPRTRTKQTLPRFVFAAPPWPPPAPALPHSRVLEVVNVGREKVTFVWPKEMLLPPPQPSPPPRPRLWEGSKEHARPLPRSLSTPGEIFPI